MLTPYTHEEQARTLRHLAHGADLTRKRFGERASHAKVVWSLIEEAVDVIDRLPDQERSWLTAGARAGGLKSPGLSRLEAELIETLRVMSSIKPFDGTTGYNIQRDDEERALDVLAWLRWLNRDRNARITTKAAIALARGGDNEIVYRILYPNRKVSRQALSKFKTKVIGLILSGLREFAGVVPGEGLGFEELRS